jgi:hypothetical protein
MKKVQEILFSDILRIISNRKSGLQTLQSLFLKNTKSSHSQQQCEIKPDDDKNENNKDNDKKMKDTKLVEYKKQGLILNFFKNKSK